jgi:hypothetical protein
VPTVVEQACINTRCVSLSQALLLERRATHSYRVTPVVERVERWLASKLCLRKAQLHKLKTLVVVASAQPRELATVAASFRIVGVELGESSERLRGNWNFLPV